MSRWSRRVSTALFKSLHATTGPFVDSMVGGATTLLANHLLPPLITPLALPLGATANAFAKNVRESLLPSSSAHPPVFVYQVPLTHPSLGPGFFGYTTVPSRTDDGLWQSEPDHIQKIYPYFFSNEAVLTEYFSSTLKIPSYQIHRMTDITWQPTLQDLWLDTRRHTTESLSFNPFPALIYFAACTSTQPPGWFAWCPVRTPQGSAYGLLTDAKPWDIYAPPWVFKSLNDLTQSIRQGMPGWTWSEMQLEPPDLMQQLTLTHQATTGDQVYTRTPPSPIWQPSSLVHLNPQDLQTGSPTQIDRACPRPAQADWYLSSLPNGKVFAWQGDSEQPQGVHWFCITNRGHSVALLWDSMRDAHRDLATFGFFTQQHANVDPVHTFIYDRHLEHSVTHSASYGRIPHSSSRH